MGRPTQDVSAEGKQKKRDGWKKKERERSLRDMSMFVESPTHGIGHQIDVDGAGLDGLGVEAVEGEIDEPVSR